MLPDQINSGKSGGTYVDCEFYKWLRRTFGQVFEDLPASKTGPGSSFAATWESTKRNFDGDLEVMHRLSFPALGVALQRANQISAAYDFNDHQIVMSG